MNTPAWTPARDRALIRLRDSGLAWRECAARLGLSQLSSSYHRYHKITAVQPVKATGPPSPAQVTRKCIMCRRVDVLGWHYCDRCRHSLSVKDNPFDI